MDGDIGNIQKVSTSNFDKRMDDIFNLLHTIDPYFYITDDKEDYRSFRLYMGSRVVPKDGFKSDILRNKIAKYHELCNSGGREDDIFQLVLHIEDHDHEDRENHLSLTKYNDDTFFTDTIITEDLAREYIEIFHERFYDIQYVTVPKFIGEYPCFLKPAK